MKLTIAPIVALSLFSCSQLLNRAGAPNHIVTTVDGAENILCIADQIGLPFESDNVDHWLPQIVEAFCAVRDGVVAMGVTEESAANSCDVTRADRARLPDDHAHAIAWDEVCSTS